ALPVALRQNRLLCVPLFMALRVIRADYGNARYRNNCPGGGTQHSQQGVFSAIPHLRVRLRHRNFHRFGITRRNHLQTLQRLERRRSARELLLLRAFSLPAITHGLVLARTLAVPARRPPMENRETQRPGLRYSRIASRTLGESYELRGSRLVLRGRGGRNSAALLAQASWITSELAKDQAIVLRWFSIEHRAQV